MEKPKNNPKLTPTPSQEASLRKLLYGSQADQEQVIAIHRPEMQKQMRDLIKAQRNADKLFAILFSDLKYATDEMKAHPGDQFWRRTAIRTLAATLDGIIFCLKQTALVTAPMNGFSLNEEELFFLSEETVDTAKGKKMRLPGFRENLKRTFKMFSKIHKISCPTDFNQNGFSSLCDTYELRHRLMHPKLYWDFAVSDEQKQKAAEAVQWLDYEIKNLLDSCNKALETQQISELKIQD